MTCDNKCQKCFRKYYNAKALAAIVELEEYSQEPFSMAIMIATTKCRNLLYCYLRDTEWFKKSRLEELITTKAMILMAIANIDYSAFNDHLNEYDRRESF